MPELPAAPPDEFVEVDSPALSYTRPLAAALSLPSGHAGGCTP